MENRWIKMGFIKIFLHIGKNGEFKEQVLPGKNGGYIMALRGIAPKGCFRIV